MKVEYLKKEKKYILRRTGVCVEVVHARLAQSVEHQTFMADRNNLRYLRVVGSSPTVGYFFQRYVDENTLNFGIIWLPHKHIGQIVLQKGS